MIAKDLLRYGLALRHSGTGFRSDPAGWISLRNRREILHCNPFGQGVQCGWQWGSDLAACDSLPLLGRLLLKAALQEWPIRSQEVALEIPENPELSFVIAHAGLERLPQLKRTIRSILAQTNCKIEIVVIDQSPHSIADELPSGVIHHHLVEKTQHWRKSWAYNVGARLARAPILVFHDGDICVPEQYASELIAVLQSGEYDVASIQRFLFYLNQGFSADIQSADSIANGLTPDRVLQNWKGGTIAIRRQSFFEIGGFDEGFVDWGGEDDEFYDRCSALRHCKYGYLPFIHLWHPPQSGRKQANNPNTSIILPHRLQMTREKRIGELTSRDFGNPMKAAANVAYKSDRYAGDSGIVNPESGE